MHAVVDENNQYRATWLGAGYHDYYMTNTKGPTDEGYGMSATLLPDVKATILSFLLISHV